MLSPHWYLVIVFPLLHLPHLLWVAGWMVWLISDTVRVSSLARIFRLNGHNVFYVATTVTYIVVIIIMRILPIRVVGTPPGKRRRYLLSQWWVAKHGLKGLGFTRA